MLGGSQARKHCVTECTAGLDWFIFVCEAEGMALVVSQHMYHVGSQMMQKWLATLVREERLP